MDADAARGARASPCGHALPATATVLKSRATDDTGAVQPEREKFIAEHGNNAIFHFHGIQAWSVAANGEVKHVYA